MTLSQTAKFTKNSILVFIILSILGAASFIGYKTWYAHYLASLPRVEEKPDNSFGALPPPSLPLSLVPSSNFTYSLDTTTGILPDFGKIVKVYFSPKPATTFLATDKAKALAQKFNIISPPQTVSETRSNFYQDNKTLTIDLDTGNFSYTNDATLSGGPSLEENPRLIEDFRNFLSSLGVLNEKTTGGKNKIELLKIIDNQFSIAQGRFESQGANIYFWPSDVDEKPILFPSFDKSLIYTEVSSSARAIENIKILNFTFWPIDSSTFATYSLKPTSQALDELKSGQGVIVKTPSGRQVSITSVYLAYFQTENYNPYLQPIYVFEGADFVAYLPAIAIQPVSSASQPR